VLLSDVLTRATKHPNARLFYIFRIRHEVRIKLLSN